jgi:hypothetical protein
VKNKYVKEAIENSELAKYRENQDARVIDLGYTPRPMAAMIHNNLKRFNVLVIHRRFGKTYLVLRDKVNDGLVNPLKNPQYAYIAPTYKQAKQVAWEYIKDFTKDIPGCKINESELRIDIHRPHGDKIRFLLLGADNPDSLRGIYLDGVVLDEYAQCDPSIWGEIIRPALADRKGWAIFIGTPKGMNHFYDIYKAATVNPNWYTCILRASETGVIDAEELASAKEEMSPEEYEQEFECSFSAAMTGAYYTKQIAEANSEGRIRNLPYEPNTGVYTAWDLGLNDTTVIWFFQMVGGWYHFIDYEEHSGIGADEYARILKSKPYVYERHFLPHDADSGDWQTGVTKVETLHNLGICNTEVVQKLSRNDGINAVRVVFKKCVFDMVKCVRGISALEAYTKKWDTKNKLFSDTPLHDWASNGADGFRYFAIAVGKHSRRPERRELLRYTHAIGYDPLAEYVDRNRGY